jgi:hypothetical protein
MMVAMEQFIDSPDFVAIHDNSLPVLGFHHMTGLHLGCAPTLVFHPQWLIKTNLIRLSPG